MANFVRTQLDATWQTGNYVPTLADWRSLDGKVFAAVNGDRGGAWAPTSPIVITSSFSGYVSVSAPVVIDYGGKVTLGNTSGSNIKLAPGVWPQFASGHALQKRTILTSCIGRRAMRFRWHFRSVDTGAYKGIRSSVLVPPSTTAPPVGFVLELRTHDGGRLTQVRLTFRVPVPRTVKPYQAPRARVVRVDLAGNVVPLQSRALGADPDGYVPLAAPATGDAWYARGEVQTFTYACDQNNVVDASLYTYHLQVLEELVAPLATPDGVTVLEQKDDVRLVATSDVTLSGNRTIDGYAVVTGDRVLAVAQSNPSLNQIWLVNTGGSWTVPTDWSVPGATPGTSTTGIPNWIVRVRQGATHAGEIWQSNGYAFNAVYGANLWTGGRQADGGYLPGNVYHAAACDFDSIADMRWQ